MKKILLGMLGSDGVLRVDSSDIFLTRSSRLKAADTTPVPLVVEPEREGRFFLVTGDLSGTTLYQAEILEEVPRLSAALVMALEKKNFISMDDLSGSIQARLPEPSRQANRLCALVIGHKKSSPGAVNHASHLTEFEFNDHLSIMIEQKVKKARVQRVYRRTYRELPDDINALGPDFAVSLHCNAFNSKASGTEVLYYHKSEPGRQMAMILLKALVSCLGLANRGVKPKTSEDRGGYLLRYVDAPVVISEPFFIDNDNDLAVARSNLEGLAQAYASAIDQIASMF